MREVHYLSGEVFEARGASECSSQCFWVERIDSAISFSATDISPS